MEEIKRTRGGRREGAGRKTGWRKGCSEQRKQRQTRTHDVSGSLLSGLSGSSSMETKLAC